MEIHILNLIQGMSTIVKHDNGSVSMIDVCTGNKSVPKGYNQPLNYLLRMDIKSLARFILTCPIKENIDGINAVYQEIGFRNFWNSGVLVDKWENASSEDDIDYNLYRDLMLERHNDCCHSLRVETGYASPYANFEVLSPSQSLMSAEGLDVIDASIVLLIKSVHGHKILFSGDVGRRAYLEMAANSTVRSKLEDIDVLIVRRDVALMESLDIVSHVIRPKSIIYGGANSNTISFPMPFDAAQINVRDFGTVIIDDTSGRLSIYAEHPNRCSRYDGDGAKHPAYDVINIINL